VGYIKSYQYWSDWANLLGVEDPNGLAEFIKKGVPVFKSQALALRVN